MDSKNVVNETPSPMTESHILEEICRGYLEHSAGLLLDARERERNTGSLVQRLRDECDRAMVMAALERVGRKKTHAAKALGISVNTLVRIMRDTGLSNG